MPRLRLTFRELIEILLAHGFVLERQKGSHRQYRRQAGADVWLVTVAAHNDGDIIKPGTLASMMRQSGLPRSAFKK
jgi:predicted RNA binding protein YcfA (HicA-like mRNA interferase family)